MSRLIKIVLGIFFPLIQLLCFLCRCIKHPGKHSEIEIYTRIQEVIQRAITKGRLDLQVFSRENIPETDGFMIYANHQGIFDVLAIAADFRGPLAAVYKHELKNIILIKQLAACTKSFAMDRADVRQSLTVIRAVTEEVKKGRNYIIFPEGTRSKSGNKMNAFHAGSFKAAMKAKCPILPVAFIDSYKALDQKGTQPVSVQMHYLKPIPYEEYQGMTAVALAELVKQRIQEILDKYA